MSLAEHDDMVEALASERADEALRGRGFCHGQCGSGGDFLDAHAFDALPNVLAVDAVAIAEEIGGCGVVREGVDELLGGPGGGGMLGDAEVDDPSTMVSEHDEDEEHPQARGGHREKIDGDQVPDVVGEERPPAPGTAVCAASGAAGRRCARRRLIPSSAARRVLGAPPKGFAAAMRVIKARSSAFTGGRPPVGCADSWVRYRGSAVAATAGRCRESRSGDVTATPVQTLARPTQNRRSVLRSLGRATVLLYTASC